MKKVPEKLEHKEHVAQLYHYLHMLDERELEIVTLRYGLNQQDALTQKEIAKTLKYFT